MKLSALMVINAIIAAIFGVAFVVVPGQFMSLYGPAVTPDLVYVGRLFGAALLTLAVLTWTAKNAPDSEARRAILLAMVVGDAIGFVVSLIGQIRGIMNALGWSTVVIYLLLAVAFGYFCFAKPKAPAETPQAM
jgi:hypothetical protein